MRALSPRAAAFAVAAAAVGANLVLEHVLLYLRPAEGSLIPGLLAFRPTWNPGISFGLFSQTDAHSRLLLVVILIAISVFVAGMAWNTRRAWAAFGLGLILGGALGNLLDRVLYGALLDRALYGAVFDFLAVHLGAQPFFICNLSDIYISVGVCVLLADELLPVLRRD